MQMTLNTKLMDAVCSQLDSPKGRRLGEAGCHVLLAMAKFTDAAGLARALWDIYAIHWSDRQYRGVFPPWSTAVRIH
jgi:hypothetical protein